MSEPHVSLAVSVIGRIVRVTLEITNGSELLGLLAIAYSLYGRF